jgi:malate dehydrogenase (quinone)
LAALLGASPGASTSVSIMLELIHKCFKEAKSEEWQAELKKIIPSYGKSLAKDAKLAAKTRAWTTEVLQLGASHYSEELTA